MANLITTNLTYSKENALEYFFKPLFIENDIRDMVDIRTNIKSGEKLNFVDSLEFITKSYAQGSSYVSATGVTITQKTLTVADMKAEVKQNGKAFAEFVGQSLLKQGYSENDISGTLFEEVVMNVFMNGLKADLQRQLWLGDTIKEVTTSDVTTGVADVRYNSYDGFWTRIIEDFTAGTIPAAQKVSLNSTTYLNTIAVAEVDTATLTGTSGTCNVVVNGTSYLATFATSLTITAAAFVTSHAAAILAREGSAVVTSSGADIIVTSGVAGHEMVVTVSAALSGNLTGSVVVTTANVEMGTLKTDAAKALLKAVYATMPAELKVLKKDAKLFVTSSIADNYRDSLETGAHDSAAMRLIDGVETLYFRGIQVIEQPDWDLRIEANFGAVRKHRILLTIPKNLVVGVDGAMSDGDAEMFYDNIEQNNIFRVEYKVGTQYIHPNYICASY